MTTSTFSASALPALQQSARTRTSVKPAAKELAKRRHTLGSSLAFLSICVAITLTTLAYGTVHYWALAVFTLSAGGLICFWCLDGFVLRSLQLNRNLLQLPVLGMIVLGLVQLLPLTVMVPPPSAEMVPWLMTVTLPVPPQALL